MTDSHSVLALVQGSVGQAPVKLGRTGRCRYCGQTNPRLFRNTSHTFPEALGNKWVISLDECDACNKLFARYDDALAKSIGAVLTLGGTIGKRNAVRQTGRTGGAAVIQHDSSGERRRISIEVKDTDLGEHVLINPNSSEIRFVTPVAPERFIPRHAYKALAKMGLALLPEAELSNFDKLRAWVCDVDDTENIPNLTVGLSFGSLGNAPPLVAAAVLKRTDENPNPPYAIFVISIGSVCCQIDLKPDILDGPWPPPAPVRCGVRWANELGPDDGRGIIRIEYGTPKQLDWSSNQLSLPPLESLVMDVNILTNEGTITPVFRQV